MQRERRLSSKSVDARGVPAYGDRVKILHVHVPKTAGSNYRKEGDLGELFRVFCGCGDGTEVSSFRYKCDHLLLTPELREEYDFVFCCVRDPFERAVSLYNYFMDNCGRERRNFREELHKRMRGTSFEEFVRDWDKIWAIAPKSYRLHFDTQARLVMIDGEVAVDFIVRCESFWKDTKRLLKQLGIKCPAKECRKNASRWDRKTLADYYVDPETVRRIRERFAIDFEMFGYSTEVQNGA